jgi:hypothetical protein
MLRQGAQRETYEDERRVVMYLPPNTLTSLGDEG